MKYLNNNIQTDLQIEMPDIEAGKQFSGISKNEPSKKISLTFRDYEVLRFILEMKFSSIDEIHLKFFKHANIAKPEVGQTYVIKRLAQLENEGLLGSTKAFDANKRLYFCTRKTYSALVNVFPQAELLKSSGGIDGRTVAHDYFLLKLRLELEVSVKAKAIYQDKVLRYVNFIRSNMKDPEVFKQVHCVVFSHISFNLLTTYTSLYRQFFKIEKAETYELTKGLLK